MLRRSSSSFFGNMGMKPARSSLPLPHSHPVSKIHTHDQNHDHEDSTHHHHGHQHGSSAFTVSSLLGRPMRFPLLISLFIALLFLISSFSHPDPNLSHTLQFPGLFPSTALKMHVIDPTIARHINSTYTAYLDHCPTGSSPVYLDPSLTVAQRRRYDGLKDRMGRYMLVTNTRQIADHLPDLLNAIIVLTTYLGPDKLAISILEGPSSDCTASVLQNVLIPLLHDLGVSKKYVDVSTDEPKIDWNQHNRIEKISELRNRAMKPLWKRWNGQGEIGAVVFFNDVYIHAADVLELLFQHQRSGGSITTGMDWWKKRPEYYYDIWVGRTIDTGDLFYPIEWSWWTPSSDLFPNSPLSKARYATLSPFQVYSTWNAMAVLSPEPFLPPHNVRFRRSGGDECAASECTLIASDIWKLGHGKVQVVPSVQFAYERDVALDIVEDLHKQKEQLGWKDGVPSLAFDTTVEWTDKPPSKVRCHPWPETNGLSANVWEETRWVDPW